MFLRFRDSSARWGHCAENGAVKGWRRPAPVETLDSTGGNGPLDAIFGRVKSTTTVDFGSTRYTRFGVWNRTTSANAGADAEAADPGPNGVFAYSPLEATAYSLNDPNFPGGGEATYEGTAYMVETAGTANAVATILFTATDINVARSETDNTLSFDGNSTTVRLRHTDIRVTDVTGTASIDGMFVGKVIDGPLGIIGAWDLTGVTGGDDLVGAYGADLQP